MKNTVKLFGLLLVVLFAGFGLSSCSSDDDKNPADFTEMDGSLVGTWTRTESGNGWTDTETIIFQKLF